MPGFRTVDQYPYEVNYIAIVIFGYRRCIYQCSDFGVSPNGEISLYEDYDEEWEHEEPFLRIKPEEASSVAIYETPYLEESIPIFLQIAGLNT